MEFLLMFGFLAGGLAMAGVFDNDDDDQEPGQEIEGTDASERLNGGDGNDLLLGDGGDDTLVGGDGRDGLIGDRGDDRLWGGDGGDVLAGGSGDDRLYGGEGDDLLEGWFGEDTLLGQEGDDILLGAAVDLDSQISEQFDDADVMRGGQGDDHIVMGSGDEAYGDEGADMFVTGTHVDATDVPVINDWELDEDMLTIVVDNGDTGAVTIAENSDGVDMADIFVDGVLVAQVAGAYGEIGLDDITVLQAANYEVPEFEPIVLGS